MDNMAAAEHAFLVKVESIIIAKHHIWSCQTCPYDKAVLVTVGCKMINDLLAKHMRHSSKVEDNCVFACGYDKWRKNVNMLFI